MQSLITAKQQTLADLTAALPAYRPRLDAIDPRLTAYVADAISNDGEHANLYELLGIRKVFRLMDSYDIDTERVKRTLRAIEGVWENGRHKNRGSSESHDARINGRVASEVYRHVKGGLSFDTPRGNRHVRLMPYQVWCLLGIYGFVTEVSMERPYTEGDELLPTEFVRDGTVYDRRRLTEECHLFQTRKSGKTEFGAAIDFVEVCFLGPANGQALICAPTSELSQIAYKAIKEFAVQVDPTCLNRMGGKLFRMTARGMNWQPAHRMKGEIRCMAAGKTPKDGLYASVVHADEHGQPGYINGHCDMQSAVETCWGSTGPRREKLLLHTTTAGLQTEGPYKNQLQRVEQLLLDELNIPLDHQPHRTDEDKWFAFLLRLDPWETDYDLDRLDDPVLFRKVNRSIGTTVQPTYYRQRLHDARMSEDTRKEVLTKDFNIWQTGRITKWIDGDRIRPLQDADPTRRIDRCTYDQGWRVFCGMDFAQGHDLFAITYLAVDYNHAQHSPDTMRGLMFADTEAWVLESELRDSPNRPLYETWIEQGWLHLCPGETFDSMLAISRLAAHLFHPKADGTPDLQRMRLDIAAFGYDPAQSRSPINNLQAWLQSLGITGEAIRQMVLPVSQSAMTMNPIISHLEEMILGQEPWITFSASPLWPWCFGNCGVELGRTDLRRITKGGTINGKIDPVAALLDACWLFDLSEGRVERER